ncbi:MAG TPA: M67 family metallopeptidase [Acidimicrobiales bacterium]|nr:M67 family metallopeptidase [Acidimicrobiales bacterium]
MLRLALDVHRQMVGHCLDRLPEEACGLLAGPPGADTAEVCYPVKNVDESARTYTLDSLGFLRADRDADQRGLEVIGVFHSHTHTAAYPSSTDVEKAPDPGWHYVLVSLRHGEPAVRSFRIDGGNVAEEPVVVDGL